MAAIKLMCHLSQAFDINFGISKKVVPIEFLEEEQGTSDTSQKFEITVNVGDTVCELKKRIFEEVIKKDAYVFSVIKVYGWDLWIVIDRNFHEEDRLRRICLKNLVLEENNKNIKLLEDNINELWDENHSPEKRLAHVIIDSRLKRKIQEKDGFIMKSTNYLLRLIHGKDQCVEVPTGEEKDNDDDNKEKISDSTSDNGSNGTNERLDHINHRVCAMINELQPLIVKNKLPNTILDEEENDVSNAVVIKSVRTNIPFNIKRIHQELDIVIPKKELCGRCGHWLRDVKKHQRKANYCILGVPKGSIR